MHGINPSWRRDGAFVLVGISALLIASWAYLLKLVWGMKSMNMGTVDQPMGNMVMGTMQASWSLGQLAWLIMMWAVMMSAMMVPTAIPMLTTFAAINRKGRHSSAAPLVSTGMFGLGYLLVWFVFSSLAGTTQWALHETILLSPMMVSTSPVLGGTLLMAAGIFQWTPFKKACLRVCRNPFSFIMTAYHSGKLGALGMGLRHGTFCVGCCWLLMTLLFFGGVMNLVWIVGLSAYVLLEKIAPQGFWLSRLSGLSLFIWGALVLRPVIF